MNIRQLAQLGSVAKRTRKIGSRGTTARRETAKWKRCMPHARRALAKLGRVEHSLVERQHSISLTPSIDAKPQALLKAWRCLSAALFAGALATPAMAAMDMSEFGEEGVPLQLHHTMGGGGSASKYYLGLGAGVSRVDPETISDGFSVDEPDSEGVKVFFGKYFLPKWRWEVGYTDAGTVGLNGPSGRGRRAEVDYKIPSIAIDYLLREPSAKLNFYLRGGAAILRQASDDTRIEFEDENEAVGMLGLGMQWRMGSRLEARLGFESYGKDVAFGSLSLAAKLGGQHRARLPGTSTAESMEMTSEPVELPQVMTAPANNSVETPNSSDARLCKSVDRELSGVNFDSGSSVLSAGAKQQLDKVAAALKQGPNIRVTVRGYTDSRGNSTKNQLLSQQRAQAVASYLMMSVGNFNNAPRAVGMGESNPIASNDTASGRAKNRRIELNLRAGQGCDDVAKSMEMDDKSRVFAGKVVETAALSRAETAQIVPEASVQAHYGAEHSSCRINNRVIEGLHFGVGEFTLDSSGKRALMPILALLRNDSSLQVQINGHTDSVGKREANQSLSAMRARSVAAYLMSQAPNLSTVPHVVGAGEMTPIASNATELGRARNRRIEITLAGGRSCHLPVQQAQSTFNPPVRVSKKPQPVDNIVNKQVESAEDNAAASAAQVAQAAADKATQLAADQAAAAVVAAKLRRVQELKEQVLKEARQTAGLDAQEQGVEVLDQVTAPVAEALQEQPINALPIHAVSPIAEPALSDTIDLDGESSPVASSQACNGIDRVASGIQFAPGETRMDKQARKVLDPVIQLLRRDPGIEVIVERHTDDVGSARDNMALSERRAKTVAAYIAGGAGMKKNLPLALGFGETKPVHSNTTASGRSANRRIVLKLHGGRGCLSNDMLAGIAGLEEIKAPSPTNVIAQALAKHEADSKPEAVIATKPAVAALADNRATMSESFSEVMARISRGHGACGKQAHVVEAIEFNSGDHRLDIEDQRALMPLVTLWREKPQLDIQVLGYTDNSGSRNGNQRLSQRRADSVAQFLMFEAGLAESAPKAKGMEKVILVHPTIRQRVVS